MKKKKATIYILIQKNCQDTLLTDKNKEQKNVCSICVNQREGKIKRNIMYIIACILRKYLWKDIQSQMQSLVRRTEQERDREGKRLYTLCAI